MGTFFLQLLQDYGGELLSALAPSIVAAFLASKLWKQRAVWLRRVVAVVAKAVVANVETEYVEPAKEASGLPKLTLKQQVEAKHRAQSQVQDAMKDLGLTIAAATIPVIGAGIERAVENLRGTLPSKTQAKFQ